MVSGICNYTNRSTGQWSATRRSGTERRLYDDHDREGNGSTYSLVAAALDKMFQDDYLYSGTPRGGAEGVIARGPGDTEGPWVQNCQDRMQNYGLRTPLVYLGGAIVLCTPPPF